MNDAPQSGQVPPEQPTPPPGPAPTGWETPPPGYAQQPWPAAPPGWGYPAPLPPAPPTHPDANTALIWGIVALFGGMSFCLPLLVSPFAWYYGSRVVREITSGPQPLGGLSEAKAGKVMGIVGTCLLGLAVLGVLGLIALTVFAEV